MPGASASAANRAPQAGSRTGRRPGRLALPIVTAAAIGYLLVPIAVMIVFSFNDPVGKFNYQWNEFSLEGWLHPLGWPGLGDSLFTSIAVAFLATLGATILGTLIGLALTRYSFRGRGSTNSFIFIPMATPEIVLGASLLTLFVATALPPLAGAVPTLYPTG